MHGTVIIFVKAPRAGQVKTRLAAGIGAGRATTLFRIMTERTIGEAGKGEWKTLLAVDPPGAVSGFENLWPPHLKRIPQEKGNLGKRMACALDAAPPGPVVIIGSDAPGMRVRHLRAAFKALKGADAVFGPATDGGYWLIGLARRRAAPDLFSGVRWSTKHALSDTTKTMPNGFQISFLETLADIDEERDLVAFNHRATAR